MIVVRHSASRWQGGKGTWFPTRLADGQRSAMLVCPTCGQPASLSNHVIEADGSVTPSVVCPYECPFHEFIQLADWFDDDVSSSDTGADIPGGGAP